MNIRNILLPSLLAVAMGASAQSEISHYVPGVTAEGAVYFLPNTALRVTVMVEKTTYTPGEFAKYAERYLHLKGVGQEATTTYKLLSADLSAYGEANTRKGYAVKYDTKSVAANVKLADDGRLLSINADGQDSPSGPAKFTPARKAPKGDARKYLSEEILSAGSTAKMAELTAQDIYDIRDSKNQLNRGEADFMPKDGAQLRIMLDNLDTQDRMMTSLFTGTEERDTLQETFTICADGELQRQVVFRLSQQLGIVDADDLSGAPFYLTVSDLKSLPEEVEDPKAAKKKKSPESGIYVCVPGKAKVSLHQGSKLLADKVFPYAQFGRVELLSAELFNKRATTHLTVNPTTGAVDKLEAELPK